MAPALNFRLPNLEESTRHTYPAPVIAYRGREFSGLGDYDNLRGRFSAVTLGGGALSIAFTARWDSLRKWSRIIDFGDGPGGHNIVIGNRNCDDTLIFNVWVSSKEYGLHIPKAIVLGETHRYLCTVTPAGHMQVFRDEQLVGETARGAAPHKEPRRFLYIGGSNWARDDGFHGRISDLVVWTTLVDWYGRQLDFDSVFPAGLEQAATPSTASSSANLPGMDWPGAKSPAPDGPVIVGTAAPEPSERGPTRTDRGVREADPTAGGRVRKLDLAARGPVLSYPGRAFAGTDEDFEDLAKRSGSIFLEEAFSIAFTARWDSLNGWSRILDFGNGEGKGNIFIGNKGTTGMFVFHVWIEDREHRVQIPDAINTGETHRYLCTMSTAGQMQVYKDGDLIGKWWAQATPKRGIRRRLYVAKSNWSRDQPFHGVIQNLGVWNDVMHWKETLQVGRFGFSGRALLVDLSEVEQDAAAFEGFEGLDWLESRMRACLNVGWGVRWHHGIDYVPALMYFVGEDTALLLRTHRSKTFLPEVVKRALDSENLVKVTPNFDEKHRGWIQHAFDIEPSGVMDLARLAAAKGLQAEATLGTLADQLGMSSHRMPPSGPPGSWVGAGLSDEQIRTVADDAHLSCLLLDKIWELPDVSPVDGPVTEVKEVKEEWIKHRIVVRAGAYWCSACEKGPMQSAAQVEMHLATQKHQRRLEDLKQQEEGLSEEYLAQGIVLKTDAEGKLLGPYRCTFCNITLDNITAVDQHIRSNRHQKAVAQAVAPVAEGPLPVVDKFEIGRWNLPDYVLEANGQLVCTLCSASASSLLQMMGHLGGDKHARRCRGMGIDEILYSKERARLEVRATGCPVTRNGYTQGGAPAPPAPRPPKQPKEVREVASESVTAMLPPGWQAVWDEGAGKYYYADAESQSARWKPPPAWRQEDWSRKIDPEGRAFWVSRNLGMSFYEESSTEWRRFLDMEGRHYWSCAEKSLRFFESIGHEAAPVAPGAAGA